MDIILQRDTKVSIGNGVLRLLILFPLMNAGLRNCSTPASPLSPAATWMKYKLLSYFQGAFPSTDTHGSVAFVRHSASDNQIPHPKSRSCLNSNTLRVETLNAVSPGRAMTPTITSGSHLDVSSMADLIVGIGAGAGADEKNQYSKSGNHERPDTRVLRFLIPELWQTGLEELCEMLRMHL